jgi:hypothetical protein
MCTMRGGRLCAVLAHTSLATVLSDLLRLALAVAAACVWGLALALLGGA